MKEAEICSSDSCCRKILILHSFLKRYYGVCVGLGFHGLGLEAEPCACEACSLTFLLRDLMRYLVIDRDASLDTTIDHSRIKQFVDRWNENMKEAFHCGWLVTLDESMLWGHQRNNDHMSFVERKPRALGFDALEMSDA